MRENKGRNKKTTKTGIERKGWRAKVLNMKASCWFLVQRRRRRVHGWLPWRKKGEVPER